MPLVLHSWRMVWKEQQSSFLPNLQIWVVQHTWRRDLLALHNWKKAWKMLLVLHSLKKVWMGLQELHSLMREQLVHHNLRKELWVPHS